MSAQKVLGSASPVETKRSKEKSDREAAVVEVEGRYADVEKLDPKDYCVSGMEVESSSVSTTDNGMGRLTVRCLKYESGSSFIAVRTTFHIGMEACQYDLEDHPYVASVRTQIVAWLATDAAKRVSDGKYYYEYADGSLVEITDETGKKFCAAYLAGIKTFNRYFPVIEKIGIWKNPPGMNRNGRSFSGGTPTFSSGIGHYDAPPISLSGYASANWFKSRDEWQENADKTWTRTEQWTYTPESSSGNHAWVYNNL